MGSVSYLTSSGQYVEATPSGGPPSGYTPEFIPGGGGSVQYVAPVQPIIEPPKPSVAESVVALVPQNQPQEIVPLPEVVEKAAEAQGLSPVPTPVYSESQISELLMSGQAATVTAAKQILKSEGVTPQGYVGIETGATGPSTIYHFYEEPSAQAPADIGGIPVQSVTEESGNLVMDLGDITPNLIVSGGQMQVKSEAERLLTPTPESVLMKSQDWSRYPPTEEEQRKVYLESGYSWNPFGKTWEKANAITVESQLVAPLITTGKSELLESISEGANLPGQRTLSVLPDLGEAIKAQQAAEEYQQNLEKAKEQIYFASKANPITGIAVSASLSALSWEDPFGLKSAGLAISGAMTGEPSGITQEKILETKAKALIGVQEQGPLSIATGPFGGFATSLALGAGVGAGTQVAAQSFERAAMILASPATKAVLTTAGLVTTAAYVTPPLLEGDYPEAFARVGSLGIMAVSSKAAFEAGREFGAGLKPNIVYEAKQFLSGYKTKVTVPEELLGEAPYGTIEESEYQVWKSKEPIEIIVPEKAEVPLFAASKELKGTESYIKISTAGTGEYSNLDQLMRFAPGTKVKVDMFGNVGGGEPTQLTRQTFVSLEGIYPDIGFPKEPGTIIAPQQTLQRVISIPGFAESGVTKILDVKQVPFFPLVSTMTAYEKYGEGTGVKFTKYPMPKLETKAPTVANLVTVQEKPVAFQISPVKVETKVFALETVEPAKPSYQLTVQQVATKPIEQFKPTEQASLIQEKIAEKYDWEDFSGTKKKLKIVPEEVYEFRISPPEYKETGLFETVSQQVPSLVTMPAISQTPFMETETNLFIGQEAERKPEISLMPQMAFETKSMQSNIQITTQEPERKQDIIITPMMEQAKKQKQPQKVELKQKQATKQATSFFPATTTPSTKPSPGLFTIPPSGKARREASISFGLKGARPLGKQKKVLVVPKADWLSLNIEEMRTGKKAKHPAITLLTQAEYEKRLASPRAAVLRFPTAKGWGEMMKMKIGKRTKGKKKEVRLI